MSFPFYSFKLKDRFSSFNIKKKKKKKVRFSSVSVDDESTRMKFDTLHQLLVVYSSSWLVYMLCICIEL